MTSTISREKWNSQVAQSIRDAPVLEIATREEDILEVHSLFVESPVLNSDFIRYNLPSEIRERAKLHIRNTGDSRIEFGISQGSHSFRKTLAGKEIFERILSEDITFKDSLSDVVKWNVTDSAVKIVTDSERPPELFPSCASRLFQLYKVYRSKFDEYVYLYRQMGSRSEKQLDRDGEKLNDKRVSSVLYNYSLDCDFCDGISTVEHSPSTDYSEGFTFSCSNCNTEVQAPDNLCKDLDGSKSLGYLRSKIKQKYKTKVGAPSSSVHS